MEKREESEKKREDQRRERVRRKKMQVREKSRKVAVHRVFLVICGSGRSKSTHAEAAGAETSGQMRDEKLHAVAARSTFPSQNVQTTPGSDCFWKLRCGKSACRCGAKHISKSKVLKTDGLGPLEKVHAVVVQSTFPSQNTQNTPGSEHISKSRVGKTEGFGVLLEARMSFCVAGTRDSAPCQKWGKREGFGSHPEELGGITMY